MWGGAAGLASSAQIEMQSVQEWRPPTRILMTVKQWSWNRVQVTPSGGEGSDRDSHTHTNTHTHTQHPNCPQDGTYEEEVRIALEEALIKTNHGNLGKFPICTLSCKS